MSGKVALVTGGGRGLGRDAALRLARDGHDVIVTYHANQAAAAAVVASIKDLGRKSVALHLDVGDVATFDAFKDAVAAALTHDMGRERLDFLIQNGGMGKYIYLPQVGEADFNRFCDVHFKGVVFLTQTLLPLINDGGSVVIISSALTRTCHPGLAVLACMKAAAECFTRYVAKEMGHRGIRANSVAPGPTETEFIDAAIQNNPTLRARMAAVTPLSRVGSAADIGGVVAFLCSDAAGWINGQRLEVTGGLGL